MERLGQCDFGFMTNIFIDPNADDEPNEGPFDGYQIAIWQTDGLIQIF